MRKDDSANLNAPPRAHSHALDPPFSRRPLIPGSRSRCSPQLRAPQLHVPPDFDGPMVQNTFVADTRLSIIFWGDATRSHYQRVRPPPHLPSFSENYHLTRSRRSEPPRSAIDGRSMHRHDLCIFIVAAAAAPTRCYGNDRLARA